MEWQTIVNRVRTLTEAFEKSYKCLYVDRPIRSETLHKHIPAKSGTHYSYSKCEKTIKISIKKGMNLEIPTTLSEEITLDIKQHTTKNASSIDKNTLINDTKNDTIAMAKR